ncbi:MAG TPA: hypothetical protein VMZ29_03835 [Candidatus Bathyarchaeia archaeon]|nr:hypothetical protein [Candidatus Bathyarchaeia archaeon]
MNKKINPLLFILFVFMIFSVSNYVTVKSISYLAVDVEIEYVSVRSVNDCDDDFYSEYYLKLIGPGATYKSTVKSNYYYDEAYLNEPKWPTQPLYSVGFSWSEKTYWNVRIDDGDKLFKIRIYEDDSLFDALIVEGYLYVKKMVSAGGTIAFNGLYSHHYANYPRTYILYENNNVKYYVINGATEYFGVYPDRISNGLTINVILTYHWV